MYPTLEARSRAPPVGQPAHKSHVSGFVISHEGGICYFSH